MNIYQKPYLYQTMYSLPNSLFINPQNQTLLWNLIQESPYWSAFSSSNPDMQQWFRSMISSMHELHPSVKTLEELRRVNSEVISVCSKHMKSQCQNQGQGQNQNPMHQVSMLSQAYDVEKQKEQRIAQAKLNFDAFQDRYNAGLAKPQPPVLNLGINLDEPKITNMEELVKQHLDSRNTLQVPTWEPMSYPNATNTFA